jgi:hypothetical protein
MHPTPPRAPPVPPVPLHQLAVWRIRGRLSWWCRDRRQLKADGWRKVNGQWTAPAR